MGELLTIRGSATGVAVMTLDSELFHTTVDNIRIPKGLKGKSWAKRISGEAADVDIEYTSDVTVGTPTWRKVDSQKLASPGELALEKNKPILLRSPDGKAAFRANRVAGTGDSFLDLELELGEG